MVASSALIPLTGDDYDMLNEDISCMLLPVLFTMGFQLSTLAIAIKTYRVHVLFHNPKLKRFKLPTHRMLVFLFLFLSLPAIIIVVWWTVSPLRYLRVYTFRDTHGNPIESFGMCDAPTPLSGAMLILSFLLYGFSLFVVAMVAYKVRGVPSDYHESKWVALALVSQSQIFFISIPTIAAVYRFVLGRFILMSLVIFASVFVVLLCIFVPKIYTSVTGKDMTPSCLKFRRGASSKHINSTSVKRPLSGIKSRGSPSSVNSGGGSPANAAASKGGTYSKSKVGESAIQQSVDARSIKGRVANESAAVNNDAKPNGKLGRAVSEDHVSSKEPSSKTNSGESNGEEVIVKVTIKSKPSIVEADTEDMHQFHPDADLKH